MAFISRKNTISSRNIVASSRNMVVFCAALAIAGCATTGGPPADPSLDTNPNELGTDQPADASVEGTYGSEDEDIYGSTTSGDAQDELQQAAMSATSTFYFDFDNANIRQDAFADLQAHAAYLAANPQVNVRLEAHSDERGTREYNLGLAERRGNAVLNFLVANGASGSQLQVVSYGEERPAMDGHSENAWAMNRRVEIIY